MSSVLSVADVFDAEKIDELKVLVVDDDATNRMVLQAFLVRDGYQVVLAENGAKALEIYEQERPNLVLLDVMMPGMDGYEAAQRLRSLMGERYTPIIFVTALQDENSLARCLESGGDDFLTKPFNRLILKSKLLAHARASQLHAAIRVQRNELARLRDRFQLEHEIARSVFEKLVFRGDLSDDKIRYLISPSSVLNGDMLLASKTPAGKLVVLIGDFTGHGLPAAIGSIPVADMFYTMSSKGYAIPAIVNSMNNKLRAALPVGVFFAACIMEIDEATGTLLAWNGGIPDVVLYDDTERCVIRKIKSTHLALGIVSEDEIDKHLEVIDLKAGTRIYAYSDGLTDASNFDNEFYGTRRLEECFSSNIEGEKLFDHITQDVKVFCEDSEQNDDITLIEIYYNNRSDVASNRKLARVGECATEWRLGFNFDMDSLRKIDPLPLVMHSILEVQDLVAHKERIYMVIAELYSNALEHGILGLESEMKLKEGGFSEYYRLRAERMETYEQGTMIIEVEQQVTETGGDLIIMVEDTGKGFDYNTILPKLEDNFGFCGRGIQLVKNICTNLEYVNEGNKVYATYNWVA